MLVSKVQPNITVAVSEGTVLTVQGNAGETKSVTLENLDAANTLSYKWQYSSDGVTWTDVAPTATLAPTDHVHTDLTTYVYHRLRASGNLTMAAKVDVYQAFNNIFSFVNL
jgi:hypothetical protein